MEDLRRGVVCANLEEFVVRNMTEVMDYLRKGAVNRQVAATGSNLYSSRSHTIFTFHVIMECSDKQGDEFIKHGQINFVDLAGSECIGRSGAKDERAREAGSINQSLLTLGRVITALVDFHPHVPYRDSKLTRLLQESLGGKAKTLIIATVSPATISAEESTFTIDYAFRARSIKNQPQTISQTTSKTAIKHYIAEIEMLKAQLAASREKNGVYMDNNEYLATQAKILALENMLEESEATIRVRDGEITSLKKEAFSLEETVNKQDFEIQSLKAHAEVLSSKLEVTTDHLQATYLQLLAAEAVTDEQSATEKSLTVEAKKMQTVITTREDEVSRLLDKVDRLEKAEVARLEMTKNFLEELANGQADLKKSLTACLNSSETQSEVLGGGVEKMLVQGRSTCDTLQSALGAALSGLLSEASQAKQDMLSVLEDAGSETKSISQLTHDRFVAAGAAWDERVTALLSKLAEAGDHLQTQERTNNEVASKVKEEFEHLQEMITKLRLVQETGCKDLLTQLRNLRMTIEAQALRYERESARQLDESHEKVVAKAQHLQKAVEEMVRDLIASSEDLVNGAKTKVTEHCKTISDETGKGADGLEALSRQTLDNQLLHSDKLHIWGKASQNGLTDGLNRIAQSKDAAKAIISDKLPELLQTFQSDYQQELNSVEQLTSQKVTQVGEHLARAQSNTTKQADFIQEWTASSSAEQEKLVNDLKSNFDDSGASLQTIIKSGKEETAGYISTESGMVQAEADLAQGHLDAVLASKSRPRGDSPARLERSALFNLAATRDHVEIGKEILRAHLEGDLEWKAQIEPPIAVVTVENESIERNPLVPFLAFETFHTEQDGRVKIRLLLTSPSACPHSEPQTIYRVERVAAGRGSKGYTKRREDQQRRVRIDKG
eukprot:scaffold2694_cov159-Ochromonas_danica.AAC.5